MATEYKLKKGFQLKGLEPQVVGSQLEKIRKTNNGELRATDVVESARNPKDPLHNFFTWDNKEAAEQYRIEEARYLIRAISMEVRIEHHDPIETRLYVSIRGGKDEDDDSSPAAPPYYQNMAVAMLDPVTRDEVEQRALAELKALRMKYALVKSLSAIFDLIDKEAAAAKA